MFFTFDNKALYVSSNRNRDKSALYKFDIDTATETEVKGWLKDGHFGLGSMEPKIKSALYFLKHHGKKVVITSIDKIEDALNNKAGTHITKDK